MRACAYIIETGRGRKRKKIDSPGTVHNILPLYGSRCGRTRAPATRVAPQRVDTNNNNNNNNNN